MANNQTVAALKLTHTTGRTAHSKEFLLPFKFDISKLTPSRLPPPHYYLAPLGDLRLSRWLPDEHIWDLIARLQGFQLVNLHPCYVSLETVELEQQTHLRGEHRKRGERGMRRSKGEYIGISL